MHVMIVDDHALVRSGLRLILGQIDVDIRVSEATNGRDAIAKARREQPGLCLMDISMPGLNGIDAIPLLLQASPQTQVLMLSMHTDRQYVNEALRAGARGYLLKDSAVDELADALRALREGRPFLSRRVADDLLSDFARQSPAAANSPRGQEPVAMLTARQREVLQRIAEGQSTRDIALSLHLSVKTVETHRAELMRRLDIHDVAGLTRYALRHGLVTLDR